MQVPETTLQQMIFLITNYADLFLSGILVTLLIAVVGTLGGTLIGFVLVLLKSVKIHFKDRFAVKIMKKLMHGLATIYIDIVRGTPMMVQASVFYYAIFSKVSSNIILAGLIIVSFNTAAYIAEIIRSGINALGENQIEAARSLGMSRYQAMRYVIFPQVIKNSLPALSNELIVNVKDSSVLSVIGVMELFYSAKSASSQNYYYEATYLLVAVIYFILTFTLARILARIVGGSGNRMNIASQTVPEVV